MKLNYSRLAKMAGSMLGLDQKRLSDAIDMASSMTGNIHSKNDALNVLKANGIDNNFLSKVQKTISSNPFASKLASMAGVNLSEIQSGLRDLQQQNNMQLDSDNRIAEMKKRLERAKKL